jgi:D-alanyl-D-alanine carboxypeptidase
MKRFLYFFLCIALLIPLVPSAAFASGSGSDPFSDVTTENLLLIEAEDGEVLYERNADEKAYPASTTKLMTALVALEVFKEKGISLDTEVTLGWRPVVGFTANSSLMGLESNETISLRNILYGMLMRSGNDAAKALAMEAAFADSNASAESAVSAFLTLMNNKARELGMNSTHFATVDGRHDEEHYTTARDFGILMREVLKNPDIMAVIGTAVYDVPATNLHPEGFHLENTNKLIRDKAGDTESFLYSKCIGGKTGETNEAGYCLMSCAESGDVRLILVQFGDEHSPTNSNNRYRVAKRMYEWGFQNYRDFQLSEFGVQTRFELQAENASPLDPEGGAFIAEADITGLSVKGARSNLQHFFDDPSSVRIELRIQNVKAPLNADNKKDIVGEVDYYFTSDKPITAKLLCTRAIAGAPNIEPEIHDNSIIPDTAPRGTGKYSNLDLQRTAGAAQYSVWTYYDGALYTQSKSEWLYLYLSEKIFRANGTNDGGSVELYQRLFDSQGSAYYILREGVSDQESYLIVVDGMALSSTPKEGTLAGIPVEIKTVTIDGKETKMITDGVDDSMIWFFENHEHGYHIRNGSYYLCRSAGSGVLFWVLIVVLLLLAVIVIRGIILRKSRRRRSRRRASGRYRATWR